MGLGSWLGANGKPAYNLIRGNRGPPPHSKNPDPLETGEEARSFLPGAPICLSSLSFSPRHRLPPSFVSRLHLQSYDSVAFTFKIPSLHLSVSLIPEGCNWVCFCHCSAPLSFPCGIGACREATDRATERGRFILSSLVIHSCSVHTHTDTEKRISPHRIEVLFHGNWISWVDHSYLFWPVIFLHEITFMSGR